MLHAPTRREDLLRRVHALFHYPPFGVGSYIVCTFIESWRSFHDNITKPLPIGTLQGTGWNTTNT